MASKAEDNGLNEGNGNANAPLSSLNSRLSQIRSIVASAGTRVRQSLSNSSSPSARRRRFMNNSPKKSLEPNQPFTLHNILLQWPDGEIPWILSEHQRTILIRSWKDDFDSLYVLGSDIYSQVFQNSPEAKTLFPQVAAAGAEWQDSGKFRSQALKFVQVLSHIVKNAYHPEQMDPMLYSVGKAHRKYASRGFEPKHWSVFQKAIESAMEKQLSHMPELSDQEKFDAIEAWKFVSVYLVRKMKRGFLEDV